PYETAEIFCDHRAGKTNKAVVRYRNTWYLWTGTHYRKLDTETVRAELWAFLANAAVREKQSMSTEGEDGQPRGEWVDRRFRPEPADVNKLYDALLARPEIRVPETIQSPAWLPRAVVSTGPELPEPGDLLACSNGLVDLIA